MKEVLAERVAWRRRGVRRHYVGALVVGEDGIRLSGRDPVSGVRVALSIPLAELERVRVSRPVDGLLAGERCVVLELAASEAICLREVGVGPLHVHMLARRLASLIQPGRLLEPVPATS